MIDIRHLFSIVYSYLFLKFFFRHCLFCTVPFPNINYIDFTGDEMIPKIKKVTLSNQLMDSMIELIENGTWPLGEKLPNELDLANSFNVSRNIMRESMKILESFGILDSKTGIGTYIPEQALANIRNMYFFQSLKDNHSLEQLLETRLIIEPELVYYATLRATDEELNLLGQIVALEIKKQDTEFYQTHDLDFHTLIAKISRNDLLGKLLSSILEQLSSSEYSNFNAHADTNIVSTSRADHVTIYEAMSKKDPLLAKDIMYSHLSARMETINSAYSTNLNSSKIIKAKRIAQEQENPI